MSAVMAGMRRATLVRLAALAGGLWLAAGAALLMQGREPAPDARSGEPVLPGLAGRFGEIAQVSVTLPDEGYTLARGADGVWRLAESGGYPVRPEAMAALLDGLATLSFEVARTRDPEKFGRLGVGTPESGGIGARLVLRDGAGGIVAELIAGRKGERTYVRLAEGEDAPTWRVNGDLPPLYSRAEWLDLSFIRLPADEIAGVTVRLADGSGYTLDAVDAETFVPGEGEDGARLTSRYAPLGPGLALTRLVPADVRRAQDAGGMSALGTHETRLKAGGVIMLSAYRAGDGSGWVSVQARGEGAAMQAVNARAAGWLFRLGPQDFGDVTAPRGAVLVP